MNIVTVHGFNVRDGGDASIGKLEHFLKHHHDVTDFDYGWLGFFGVRFFYKKIARKLAAAHPKSNVAIGHSNGCLEIIKACEYGAQYDHVIFINPALDNDIEIPSNIKHLDVLHNVDDNVVTLSKFRPWLSWGDMGRVGYQGDNSVVHNHETKHLLGVSGHSAVFNTSAQLSAYIMQLIKDAQ